MLVIKHQRTDTYSMSYAVKERDDCHLEWHHLLDWEIPDGSHIIETCIRRKKAGGLISRSVITPEDAADVTGLDELVALDRLRELYYESR